MIVTHIENVIHWFVASSYILSFSSLVLVSFPSMYLKMNPCLWIAAPTTTLFSMVDAFIWRHWSPVILPSIMSGRIWLNFALAQSSIFCCFAGLFSLEETFLRFQLFKRVCLSAESAELFVRIVLFHEVVMSFQVLCHLTGAVEASRRWMFFFCKFDTKHHFLLSS